jgi:hypothetical protein
MSLIYYAPPDPRRGDFIGMGLYIPPAGDRGRGVALIFIVECLYAGKNFAFDQLQRSAAAG